ncbi:MAG: leucine-rich repeat domain-containing protein, partial [Candidatus Azobacteroides sp.]|nr:leucine-rich repeat domain-containing protein [Candidatus Azobacteroides sp.]
MKKHLLLGILTLAMSGTALNVQGQTWQIGYPNAADMTAMLSDGTLTISGTGAMQDFGTAAAPWYNVAINITSLEIEEGVTSIGANAFYLCYNIAGDVSVPNSV